MRWTITNRDWNPNKRIDPEEEKKRRITHKRLHKEANKRMVLKLRERLKR